MFFDVLEQALLKKFAWLLYLYKDRNIEINVNRVPVDYKKYINFDLSEKALKTISGTSALTH